MEAGKPTLRGPKARNLLSLSLASLSLSLSRSLAEPNAGVDVAWERIHPHWIQNPPAISSPRRFKCGIQCGSMSVEKGFGVGWERVRCRFGKDSVSVGWERVWCRLYKLPWRKAGILKSS